MNSLSPNSNNFTKEKTEFSWKVPEQSTLASRQGKCCANMSIHSLLCRSRLKFKDESHTARKFYHKCLREAPYLSIPFLELDLTKKDHLRLYIDGCAGLREEVKFDGKSENYPSFVKLIGKQMEEIRVKECLQIATEWDTTGTNPEFPVEARILNLFDTNGATKAQINHHVGLIWADTDKDQTDELPITVDTKPRDDAELDKIRNFLRLKHAMFGSLLWNSLTSSFQLEIVGQDKENFREGNKYDGVKLWYFIRAHVNPTTTIRASSFKDEIKSAIISTFKDDVKAYNTWFDDKRKAIIKEEGEGKYNEYT